MTVHLIKLSVGVEDVGHLVKLQKERLKQVGKRGKPRALWHFTRHMPKRVDELLDGGSIYWVIKGFVRARQRLIGFEPGTRPDGSPGVAILFEPKLVRTVPRSFRAFQGWRYFKAEDVPPDMLKGAESADLPAEMEAELRNLGLL